MGKDIRPLDLNILYYGAGWPTNIGNAFIDLGALAILKAAFPTAHIGFASELPRWFFAYSYRSRFNKPNMDNALDIAMISKCDIVVFSGMAMCEEFIHINGPSIENMVRKGVKVLLLGTGAAEYSLREREMFASFLKVIKPIGFISRDDVSFSMFSNYVEKSFKGIDCGFFVPEAYNPLPLIIKPYVAVNFDERSEPDFSQERRKIIRTHHSVWPKPPQDHLKTPETLVSDIPHDYLAVYANADEVHSDRVHACVATLAYGNPARFYSNTPRGSLFDAVGAESIKETVTPLNLTLLAEKKAKQISMVQEAVHSQF